MTLIRLVSQARDAGLTFTRDGDRLTVRGPKTAGPLVAAIQRRKAEVLAIVDYITGAVSALDWHAAQLAPTGSRCVLCGRRASLLDPYDRTPMHKVCAERTLTSQASTGVAA